MSETVIRSERRTKWITSNGVEDRTADQSFDLPMDAQKFIPKLIFSLKNNLFEFVFKLLFFSLLLIGAKAWGQTTRTSAQTGNWNATSTWVGGVVPASNDPVIIASGHTVTVTDNRSCASVTFTTGSATLSVNSNVTLTVSGAITVRRQLAADVTVNLQGAGSINCSSILVGNNNTVLTSTRFTQLVTTINNLNCSGNITLEARQTSDRNNNVVFDLNSGTLTLGGSFIFNDDASGNSAGCYIWVRMTQGSANGTLIFTGTDLFGTPDTYVRCPWSNTTSNYANVTLSLSSGTVIFDRNGNQNILRSGNSSCVSNTISATFNNLTLRNTGIKTIPIRSSVTVNGTLSMEGTASLTNNGTLTYGASSTLQYKGSVSQTTTSVEFPSSNGPLNLTIDNSSGVTLHSARTIGGVLTLTNGVITTTSTNTLTLTSSLAGAVSGGSSTSYVNGPLDRTLAASTNYFYPVGGNTSNYRPINLNGVSVTGNPVVRVTVFETGASTVDNSTLTSLLSARNWRIEQISGTFTSATLVITEDGMTNGTHEIGKSNSNQAGTYVSCGTPQTVSSGAISSPSAQGAGFYAIGVIYSCSPLTSAGSVTADQTICSGGDPTAFSSTAVASGGSGGTITYQWESSTTSSSSGYGDISGATSATYDAPSGLTSTTYFRRKSKRCTGSWEQTTSAITVTVNAAPTSQASSMAVSNIGTTTLTLSWSRGNGSGIAVFAKVNPNNASDPVVGSAYTANSIFGSGSQIGSSGWFCVYNGTGTSVNITGLTGGNTYNFAAYEYSSTTCYNLTEATISGKTYCTLNNNNQTTYKITSFSTSGGCASMSNTSTRSVPAGCLIDYTGSYSTSHDRSSTVSFSMASSHGSSYAIWVDWNIDGDFDDAGENVYLNTSTSNSSVNSSFSVPASATIGTTRMRVGIDYQWSLSASMQCGSNDSYSQYEDYSFVINAAGSTPTAVAGTVSAGTTPQCIGSTTTYTVSGTVLGGGTGAWSSDNTSVATVNASTGVVTAVAAGTCNIVYTVTGGCGGTKTASASYTVTPTAVAGTVSAGTTPQCIGSTTTYTVSGTVLGGGTGAWSSDNTSVATVNASTGVVTAVSAGTCNIVYTVSGGCGGTKTASASYTVTPTVTINAFSPATSTRCQGAATVTTTTTATNSTGITYSLDATTLAFSGNSINASTGAVTYAAGWSGTTTITASAAGCSGPVTTTHVVTTTSSNPTVSTTVASGDFIWYGSSTAWNTLSNWKTFNGSTYSVPSVAPSLNDRVIISSTNTCVTSQPILGSNTTIGSLIVEAGATLDQSVYNLTVKGDFTNNGTFTSGAGTTIFNGASAQTINGNSNTTFNNLTLNNSAGLTVSKGITINGVLTFTSGNISASSSSEAVTFETTGTVSGAADTKCIVGFCKKNTNSTTKFTFPVGTSTLYRQASVTPSSSSATTWTVKYYGAGYGTYTVTGGSIYQPSKREYWTIDRSGASDATIELSWGSNSNVYAPNASDLIVAHFTGTAWENAGGNNISGTSSGVVSSNTNWSAYSPFTLGSQQYAVTLPITLVSFNAKPYQKDVKVSWQTASEVDNDYFTLERSENGKDFSEITRVDGAGNSVHTISYFTMDSDFDRTILYYRLKLTSFHGEETYSDIISVDMSQTQNKGVIIMTVNSLGQEVDETAKGIVFDIYSDGTSVKRIQF